MLSNHRCSRAKGVGFQSQGKWEVQLALACRLWRSTHLNRSRSGVKMRDAASGKREPNDKVCEFEDVYLTSGNETGETATNSQKNNMQTLLVDLCEFFLHILQHSEFSCWIINVSFTFFF